jgi:hypothetical protein
MLVYPYLIKIQRDRYVTKKQKRMGSKSYKAPIFLGVKQSIKRIQTKVFAKWMFSGEKNG